MDYYQIRMKSYFRNAFTSLFILFSYITTAVAQKKPNIVLILADDMGFSDIGCYGGEVHTPNLDGLASEGIRYKQFYNAARCCPTRASLITGLYPHQAGMGWMAAADLGTPAYQDNLNNNCVTIAELLKSAGYDTYMTGKWHLTNERKIDGMVTDNWPKQRGFNHYFGIIPGGANYFTPVLYSNNSRYKAPENFYLTSAIADTSVKYIDDHFSADKTHPMFMYVAFTAPHWPLHALQKDIDKYKDVYKEGWDKIRSARFERQKQLGLIPATAVMSPRDAEVPAWESLPEEKKQDMAMRMAVYAAQIDAMDQGVGKIVAELKKLGQLDNTLIFFLSDNGACAEFISSGESKEVTGKENTFESYRINWANVSSTPFKEYKHFTYEGGIATPLIVHWPEGVDPKLDNTFIGDYGHITDIMATCADVSGANYPSLYKGNKIVPMQGKSLVPNFSGRSNNRGVVYWEHEANIAMRDGKWKLVAKTPEGHEFSKNTLELYDMQADPVEMNNLAAKYPERVNSMYSSWEKWARSIGAFPLDTREYGHRAQEYRKQVNGAFDDNLGGWAIKKGNTVKGDITIDTTSKITGKKSALAEVDKPGDRPAALAMVWRFNGKKGEKYRINLKSVAAANTSFYLRVEKPAGEEKLVDQTVPVSAKVTGISTPVFEVPETHPYQIALYFGSMNKNDKVWVDDIQLVPVKKDIR